MKDLPSLIAGVAADLLSGKTAEQNKIASQSKYGFKAKRGGPFLSPKEVSQQFTLSLKTLERLRKNGGGPPFIKTGSKHIRYPITGLDAWVDAQLEKTTTSDSE